MFGATVNPYDDLVTKATDENLASEDWDTNLQICDKVGEEGQAGARNAVAALVKRLAHRNPNVQVYALELANTLAQNCSKPLMEELASRTWTGALTRLVNDRATIHTVQRKALRYIKDWTKQFEEAGDPNLGLMSELYDQLRDKNFIFDDSEPAVANDQTDAETRRRAEEEELMRVIELSKQDKGRNWNAFERRDGGSSSSAAGPGAAAAAAAGAAAFSSAQKPLPGQPQGGYHDPQFGQPAPALPEPDQVLDINTATRVRALYAFASSDVGELSFERGDVIKVLDRGFKEWWRGAAGGKIGIFPVTYVEALPEPSPRELQEEAQEEARVFASLGLVDKLLQTLSGIDPARGDRIDNKPELEEMYQASVSLQGQINALIKKYSDQKAELEHMNANFQRAMRQYEELRGGPAPAPAQQPGGAGPYAHPQQQPAGQDPYAQQPAGQDPYAQQPPAGQDTYAQQQPQHPPYAHQLPAGQDPYAAQQQQPPQQPQQYAPQQQPPAQQYAQQPPAQQQQHQGWPQPQVEQPPNPGYYQQQGQGSTTSVHRQTSGAPSFPPASPPRQGSGPGAAGVGAGADPAADHAAAWDAYYRSQGQVPPAAAVAGGAPINESPGVMPSQQLQGGYYQQPQQQHPPAAAAGAYGQAPGQHQAAVDAAAAAVSRMSVGGQ